MENRSRRSGLFDACGGDLYTWVRLAGGKSVSRTLRGNVQRPVGSSRIVVGLLAAAVLSAVLGACAEGTPSPASTAPLLSHAPTLTAERAATEAAMSPTALPSELGVGWGEWWYEGEYLASEEKYPADPVYHERSFNVRVTIQNKSRGILPGDVLPVFYLTDGEEERPVITWYYSPEDLRALSPGESKEAVFRALTYASGQWIHRAEIRWRGQVWEAAFPRQ